MEPTPLNDGQPMETEQEIIVVDMRDKITGKPAPAKLELSTKPKPIAESVYKDNRFRNKVEVEQNSKANIDRKQRLKKNAHKHHPWVEPPISTKQRTVASKPPSPPGAMKASADHSPGRRGKKRERSPSCISVTSCSSEEIRTPPRRRSRIPRSPSRSPSPSTLRLNLLFKIL
jgi:hypothetical protein